MAAKKTVTISPLLIAVQAALAAQDNVKTIGESLVAAKAGVVKTLRDKLAGVAPVSYEAARATLAPAFPEIKGSKVHLVQLARYSKAVVAITNGYKPTVATDEFNFTNFVNGVQAHGVKAGWWEAGKGGKKDHAPKTPKGKSGEAVVLEASAALRIITAGMSGDLAEAVTAACEVGADREWLAKAWAAEKARRAASAASNVDKLLAGLDANARAALAAALQKAA